MKTSKLFLGSALLIALSTTAAFAAGPNVATGIVNTQVSAINALAVKGDDVTLNVIAAVAGDAPTEVSDSTTQKYDITTNETSRSITAMIDTVMPEGVTLKINLAAPTGATGAESDGDVILTADPQSVVHGISTINVAGTAITYKLSALSSAGVITSIPKTVTLTITNGS